MNPCSSLNFGDSLTLRYVHYGLDQVIENYIYYCG